MSVKECPLTPTLSVGECPPTPTLPVKECPFTPDLLGLPEELRERIIYWVLVSAIKNPVLSSEMLASRIPLERPFGDEDGEKRRYPVMRIYLPRRRFPVPNGAGLLLTCKKIKENLITVLEHMRNNKDKVEFVLDVMFVKDVGLVPTWVSFPFDNPGRIETLRVQIRAIRLSGGPIHPAFINFALCPRSLIYEVSDNHLLAVLAFCAFNRQSVSEIKTRPSLEDEYGICKILYRKWYEAVHQRWCEPCRRALDEQSSNESSKALRFLQKRLAHHKECQKIQRLIAKYEIDLFTANFRTKPPYVVDQMLIDVHPHEYSLSGDVLHKRSRGDKGIYTEGSLPFNYEAFAEPSHPERDDIKQLRENGRFACNYISRRLKKTITDRELGPFGSVARQLYDSLMAFTGVVKLRGIQPDFTYLVDQAARNLDTDQTIKRLNTDADFKIGADVDSINFALNCPRTHKCADRVEQLEKVKTRVELGWCNPPPPRALAGSPA